MQNVQIHDNGAAYMIMVDGLMVRGCHTLGDAWRHIEWMWAVAQQQFTVGREKTPVRSWVKSMRESGYLE